MTFRLICLLLVWCSVATGCSDNVGESRLNNYLNRLATVLAVDDTGQLDSPSEISAPLRFPEAKALSPRASHIGEDTDGKISILDFMKLYGCDLQSVVGEQNTNLAEFAGDSQTLLRSLRFIQAAPSCLAMLEEEGNQDLAEKLKAALQRKRQNISRDFWRATLGSPEARLFWKQPDQLADYPAQVSLAPVQVIGRLAQRHDDLESGHYDPLIEKLEEDLAALHIGDGGHLYAALNQLNALLAQANAILLQRQQQGRLCLQSRELFNREALQNVIQKYFVGEVQAWASELSRRYYQLMEPYLALEQRLESVEPAAYRVWREKRDQQMQAWLRAPAEHVAHLQEFMEQCESASATDRRELLTKLQG